jgi:hypothetical protein
MAVANGKAVAGMQALKKSSQSKGKWRKDLMAARLYRLAAWRYFRLRPTFPQFSHSFCLNQV